jgi:1-pyrroline-5-carboxylate dehydrogenase
MREEIFGPVLTVYVYPDADVQKTLELVDTSTPYALTGAIFGLDV